MFGVGKNLNAESNAMGGFRRERKMAQCALTEAVEEKKEEEEKEEEEEIPQVR